MDQSNFLVFLSCSPIQIRGFRCRPCRTKTSLWWRRTLTLRFEINQSLLPLMDISQCRNLKAGIKKFDFPHLSYSIRVKSPVGNISGKINFQPVVTMKYQFRYRSKTHLKYVSEFLHDQDIDASIKVTDFSFLFSGTNLRFPVQNLLEKFQPVVMERSWLWETR